MKKIILLVLWMLFSTQASWAHDQTEPHATGNLAISTAFDHAGKLWRVHITDGFVLVSHSDDLGKTFSDSIRVNAEAQRVTANGEIRPKIAIGKESEIYVTWMQNLNARFSSYIWFARSLNGGKSFEKPYIVHQDRAEIGHAFEELSVAPNGDITVIWLDARDAAVAKTLSKAHRGTSIYYAVSSDAGKTFAPEKKLADNSCECCRIATTTKPDGTVVAMWRQVFEGNERDHMIAEIPQGDAKPDPHRATFGHWVIDGCPHHGAALASGGEGKDWWGYHMAYFDGNDAKPGLYYSRMDGVAWASSPPKKFGDNAKQAGHPAIWSQGEKVWLVWREIEGKNTNIIGMFSGDGGRSWSVAKTIDSIADKADYPQLIQYGKQVYLAWNTLKKGLRLTQLAP